MRLGRWQSDCRGGLGYRPAGKLSRDNPAQLVNSAVNCANWRSFLSIRHAFRGL
jgi:hypothetical protein